MIKQLLLKKYSLFNRIILISILYLFINQGAYSQNSKIVFRNTPLDSVLHYFSDKYNIKFAFDYELVKNITVNKSINESDYEKSLVSILSNSGFEYQIINSVYVIIPDNNKKQKGLEKYSLYGVVKDKETGETLPFAHIVSSKNNIFCVSNQDGYFSLLDLPSDSITLIVSYIGYSSSVFNIKSIREIKFRTFYVSNKPLELDAAIIDGEVIRNVESNEQASLTTLNTLNIERLPSSGETDALKLIQLIPGIKCSDESSADLIIRGGTMDQNLILFDDFSLYHVDHMYGMVSSLNSKAIKHIQVYKGGFDARYGGRMNSVVNITGKSGNTSKASVDAGINMLSGNLLIEAPLFKKGSILIAARRSYTDLYQTPLFNQLFKNFEDNDQNTVSNIDVSESESSLNYNPVFYFYDINAKISYSITSKDNLSLSYYSSLDKLKRNQTDYSSLIKNDDILGNNGFSLRWGRQWNDRFYSRFLISNSQFLNEFLNYQKFDFGIDGTVTFKIQNNNQVNEKSLKLYTEYKISDKWNIDLGYDVTNQNIDYILKYSYTDSTQQTANSITNESFLHSLYIQGRLMDYNNLNISLGLRSSYYKSTNSLYFEPRVNLSYSILPELSIKAAAGIYNQFVTKVYTGEEISNSRSLWFTSDNNDIPIGKSNHYILGLQYKKNKFIADIELYRKDVEGIVKYVYDYSVYYQTNSDSIFYETGASFQNGSAVIQGIELLISNDFGNFYSWISYSLSENYNKFNILNNGDKFPSINDQRHELKIAGIESIKKWELAFTWLFGSGFIYSQPYYSIDNYTEETIKLPNYHKLDLSVIYNFNIQKMEGNIGVSFLNVYNRDNKKTQELIPYVDNSNTYYQLTTIDLPGTAVSAFFNIKL